MDAVSDAVVAESVYQAVRGNTARTASTLDAIARGEAPPPELEVVRTPAQRRGVDASAGDAVQRQSARPRPAGSTPAQSARASAEPHLNAFAARLLGRARERALRGRTSWIRRRRQVVAPKEIALNELGLAPLDFIYAVEGGSQSQRSEIEQRILHAITRKAGRLPAGAMLRINPGRQAAWGPGDLSYGEFAEVLRTARKLITGARALDAGDLNLPERAQASGVDLAELEARANRAEQSLRQAAAELQTLLNAPPTANLESLRTAHCCNSLASACRRRAALGDRRHAGRTRRTAGASRARSRRRLAAKRTRRRCHAALNPRCQRRDDQRNHHIERLARDFRKSLCRFAALYRAATATSCQGISRQHQGFQDNDPLAVVTWFQRSPACVTASRRLAASLRYAEALNTGESSQARGRPAAISAPTTAGSACR